MSNFPELRLTVLTATLLVLAGATCVSAQQIAFTWDDLPAHSTLPKGETRAGILRDIVNAMQSAKMPPVYGFVNGVQLKNEPRSADALALWQKAGLPVGNHTWSHMNLNEHTAKEWEADFERNESTLAQYAGGLETHWLRYPYLAEGNTDAKRDEVRAFLAQRHYKIAAVSMSFSDYAYNEPYARCVANPNPASIVELEIGYLSAADREIDYSRSLAQAVFGHDIPYVLLMHVGAFDARMLLRLIDLYERRGFTFVTLEQAEADPFYANDLDPSLPAFPDTLEDAAKQKNVPLPPRAKTLFDPDTVCRTTSPEL